MLKDRHTTYGTFCEPVTEVVIARTKAGVPFRFACEAGGTSPHSGYRWMNRGQECVARERETGVALTGKDYLYAKFFLDMQAARAEAIAARVSHIADAGSKGAWQADAWWLERQVPQEFGQVNRHELTGAEGGAIQIGQAEIIKQAQEIVGERMKELPKPDE
jgi:hypothetical protein